MSQNHGNHADLASSARHALRSIEIAASVQRAEHRQLQYTSQLLIAPRPCGSDSSRVYTYLTSNRTPPDAMVSGSRPAAWRTLASLLQDPGGIAAFVQQLNGSAPLLDPPLLEQFLLHHARVLATKPNGFEYACMRQLQSTLIRSAASSSDGAKIDTTRSPPPAAHPPRAPIRSVPANYPPLSARVKGKVGRLPQQEAGALPAAPRLSNAQLRNPECIEEGELISSTAVCSLAPQSTRALHLLLRRTHKVFPYGLKPFSGWTLPPDGIAAVRELGGIAFISKQLLKDLIKARIARASWLKTLGNASIPTFTASTSCNLIIIFTDLSPASGDDDDGDEDPCLFAANAHIWATLLGVPIHRQHPIRLAISSLPESAARAAIGQAVDVDVARLLMRHTLELIGCSDEDVVRYADLMSGISVFGGAVYDLLGPRMKYLYGAERLDIMLSGHAVGWAKRIGTMFSSADDVSLVGEMRNLNPTTVQIGLRCAPWTLNLTKHPIGSKTRNDILERALEEAVCVLNVACGANPLSILLELSPYVTIPALRPWWLRLQAIILKHAQYTWKSQNICPKATLRKLTPRNRKFVRGLLVSCAPGPTSASTLAPAIISIPALVAAHSPVAPAGPSSEPGPSTSSGPSSSSAPGIDRVVRGSTRRRSVRGAYIGVYTEIGRVWRTAPVALITGEDGTLVERCHRGVWSHFCLIAPSLHLKDLQIAAGGYFNLLPNSRRFLAQFTGAQIGKAHATSSVAIAAAASHAAGLAESCILVLQRGETWIVLDAAGAGPPYLQKINDAAPHAGANVDVTPEGKVYLDGTVDTYNLDLEHHLQISCEVLWIYGKYYREL